MKSSWYSMISVYHYTPQSVSVQPENPAVDVEYMVGPPTLRSLSLSLSLSVSLSLSLSHTLSLSLPPISLYCFHPSLQTTMLKPGSKYSKIAVITLHGKATVSLFLWEGWGRRGIEDMQIQFESNNKYCSSNRNYHIKGGDKSISRG